MSEYRPQEPSHARALDFYESVGLVLPSPAANGAAAADGAVGEAMLWECKHLVQAKMVAINFKWKLIAMIQGKHLLIAV